MIYQQLFFLCLVLCAYDDRGSNWFTPEKIVRSLDTSTYCRMCILLLCSLSPLLVQANGAFSASNWLLRAWLTLELKLAEEISRKKKVQEKIETILMVVVDIQMSLNCTFQKRRPRDYFHKILLFLFWWLGTRLSSSSSFFDADFLEMISPLSRSKTFQILSASNFEIFTKTSGVKTSDVLKNKMVYEIWVFIFGMQDYLSCYCIKITFKLSLYC